MDYTYYDPEYEKQLSTPMRRKIRKVSRSEDEIRSIRQKIVNKLVNAHNNKSLADMLPDIFKYIDEDNFGGAIRKKLDTLGIKLKFVKRTLRLVGGFCKRITEKVYHMNINEKLWVFSGKSLEQKIHTAVLIIEHEMVHLLVFIYGHYEKTMEYVGHGLLFRCTLYALFGHVNWRNAAFVGKTEKISVGSQVGHLTSGYVGEVLRIQKNKALTTRSDKMTEKLIKRKNVVNEKTINGIYQVMSTDYPGEWLVAFKKTRGGYIVGYREHCDTWYNLDSLYVYP